MTRHIKELKEILLYEKELDRHDLLHLVSKIEGEIVDLNKELADQSWCLECSRHEDTIDDLEEQIRDLEEEVSILKYDVREYKKIIGINDER